MPLPVNPSVRDLIKAGALHRAMRRAYAGWSDQDILLYLEDEFFGADANNYREILRLARETQVARAKILRGDGSVPLADDQWPIIPPG